MKSISMIYRDGLARETEVPHEFRIRDGGHSWTYWRESLPKVLEFVSDAFHQF